MEISDLLTHQRVEAISGYLRRHPMVWRMVDESDSGRTRKAGAIVFFEDEAGARHYAVMKPRASLDKQGAPRTPPAFQIATGNRCGWQMGADGKPQLFEIKGQDIAADLALEPYCIAAIREAIEELGLKLENVMDIYDLGTCQYVSESTGKPMFICMIAIKIASKDLFAAPCSIHAKTEAVNWVTVLDTSMDDAPVRRDHARLLTDFDRKLNYPDQFFTRTQNGCIA